MSVIRSHRIALDPTVEQSIALARACGVARFTWNWALGRWEEIYQAGGKPNALELKKEWNAIKREHFPWVLESPKDANQQPFAFLGKAFSAFFKNKRGRPNFKKRGEQDSFYVSNDKFHIEGSAVKLPVIGRVRMREQLRFSGKIMSGTISRSADRWFLAIQVESELEKLPTLNNAVGIDMGLITAVACSDGKTFSSPKPLKARLKLLQLRSQHHSRKKKGSKNRDKSRRRLARLHNRIKNIRRDWTHKVTTKLIRENQTICLEDLNVKGLMANRKLSRAIQDVGWYELRRQLEYKAQWYGRNVHIVGRFVPTSKVCSSCGHRKEKLSLKERTFQCDKCSMSLDRDINAALNIRTAGLAGIACGLGGSDLGQVTKTKQPRVEAGTRKETSAMKSKLESSDRIVDVLTGKRQVEE